MKKIVFLLFLFTANQNFAQLKTHTFEQAEKLAKENPKPFFVFLHTNWCKYCKMLENTTFKNNEIIKELNENFYFISFDAEGKADIVFNGNTFKFKPKGSNSGIHELAAILGNKNGNITYPTITILESDYSILLQIQSFTNAKNLLEIIEKLKN